MVGGVRTSFLQVLRPHEAVQVQEEPAVGAAVQQVRGTECVENIQGAEEEELNYRSKDHFFSNLFKLRLQ